MKLNKRSILGFFKNSLITKSINVLFIRISGVVLFFGLTLFLTNFFDPGLVGKYDFSRSLLIFTGAIVVFGMHQAIIYYSGYLTSINNLWYIKKVYYKMILIVFVLSTILFLGSQLLKNETISSYLKITLTNTGEKTIMALFFYGLTMLNIDVFRAINKIYFSEIFRNIIRYVLFFLAILIIYFNNNTAILVDVFLINFIVLAAISTLLLIYYFSKKDLTLSPINIGFKSILKRSAPMAISATSFLLMQSLDILMLTKFSNYETVAYYGSAVKLTMIIAIVLSSVNSVLAPQMSKYFSSGNMETLKENIKRGTRLIFIITFPMILALAIFPNFVLGFFGEDYKVAKTALIILLVGQVINALCGSVGIYLNMTGKQKIFQRILIFALSLNIILNFILIPKIGMIGAAIATSTSMILWNLIAVIYVYKKDRVKIYLTIR
jgi:O-antigen/teichoic acid export membrane protein